MKIKKTNTISYYKKILSMFIIVSFIICCSSCEKSDDKKIGSGTKDKVEAFDWSKYDKLIDESKHEIDQNERNKKMCEAENMLLDTGAVIPLFGAETQYLCRQNIKDFYISYVGTPIIKFTYPKDNKKELNVFISDEPDSFDAAKSSSMEAGTLVENYQGNLYRSTKDGVEKELASDLDISKDKLTYTVSIKKDAKWSDGKDVTADDFEYTWRRAAKEENATDYGFMFEPIEGYPNNLNIKAIDKKTLKIKLGIPCPYFKNLLAHSCYAPIRKDVVESAKGYKDEDGKVANIFAWGSEKPKVSCGAFTVESWKHKSSIVLKKNPTYVFADKVKVDKVHLMLSNDANSIYQAYQTGDIDIDINLPSDEIVKLRKKKDYHTKKSQEMAYIYFSLKSDLFKGMTADEAKKFRKAIGYAIDRDFISKSVLMSDDLCEGRIVSSAVHDGTGKKYIDTVNKIDSSSFKYGHTKDLDKSREMLKEIGYEFDDNQKLKQDITIEYTYYESGNYKSVASCLQSDLEELGIKLVLKNIDHNLYNEERREGNFEAARARWLPDYDDPMAFLELFTTNSNLNCPQLGRLDS